MNLFSLMHEIEKYEKKYSQYKDCKFEERGRNFDSEDFSWLTEQFDEAIENHPKDEGFTGDLDYTLTQFVDLVEIIDIPEAYHMAAFVLRRLFHKIPSKSYFSGYIINFYARIGDTNEINTFMGGKNKDKLQINWLKVAKCVSERYNGNMYPIIEIVKTANANEIKLNFFTTNDKREFMKIFLEQDGIRHLIDILKTNELYEFIWDFLIVLSNYHFKEFGKHELDDLENLVMKACKNLDNWDSYQIFREFLHFYSKRNEFKKVAEFMQRYHATIPGCPFFKISILNPNCFYDYSKFLEIKFQNASNDTESDINIWIKEPIGTGEKVEINKIEANESKTIELKIKGIEKGDMEVKIGISRGDWFELEESFQVEVVEKELTQSNTGEENTKMKGSMDKLLKCCPFCRTEFNFAKNPVVCPYCKEEL